MKIDLAFLVPMPTLPASTASRHLLQLFNRKSLFSKTNTISASSSTKGSWGRWRSTARLAAGLLDPSSCRQTGSRPEGTAAGCSAGAAGGSDAGCDGKAGEQLKRHFVDVRKRGQGFKGSTATIRPAAATGASEGGDQPENGDKAYCS